MSELAENQEQLGNALNRARGGEDRELANQVRDLGQMLVRQLFGLLRLIRTHELNNEVFQKPIEDLRGTIATLLDLLGAVHIAAVEDQVYVNDTRIRMDERVEGGRTLGQELRRHQIGGFSFHAVPSNAELRHLVRRFSEDPSTDRPRVALLNALHADGVEHIDLAAVYRFRVSGEESTGGKGIDEREVATRTTGTIETAIYQLGKARMPNPLPMRRAVTEMLEAGAGAEGLWEAPAGATAFSAHTLRVALIASLIGEGLGVSEEVLQDLGVAAMFHDVGYAAREGAVAAKDGKPGQPGFAPPFERHGAAGARLLLRQRGFHEAKIQRALATLQHHRDFIDPRGRPTLFARILRVAEDYDTMVTPRRGGPKLRPSEALGRLRAGARHAYDPVLVQILINRLGRFPPGMLLDLADGRVVRVVSVARTPETWAKPLCQVLVRVDGTEPEELEYVDLAEEGRPIRER